VIHGIRFQVGVPSKNTGADTLFRNGLVKYAHWLAGLARRNVRGSGIRLWPSKKSRR